MFIIPREWWGARPPKNTPFKIKTPTPELWLHHAAGAMLPGDDQVSPIDYQRIRAIQNFHMDKRGWNDIAYSWLVDTDGYVFEGRGAGVAGGHTKGHNTVSHAICVMGNYDLQPPDPNLLPRIAELVRYTHSQGWTPRVFTGGHRDVGATSCPGNKLYPQLPELNRLIMEEDMPLNDDDLNKIEALLDKKVGPIGVITDPNGNARPFHQYTVNGVWHANANGKRMMDHLLDAADKPIDETALAKAIVAELSPGLRAAVAAELNDLTLRAT